MPPDNETPAQTMARVSRVLRSDARPTLGGGYQADIGVGSGPLSGGVFAAGAPVSGQPQAAGANVGVGPLTAQFVQPTFKGAQPSYGVGFNADEYFGANVMKTPQGMQYGVRAGPVSASYNPTRKDLSIMGGFERRFADGGPVLTSKRIASSFVPPEEQGAISPSMEGVVEGAQAVGRGLGPALQATGEYITSTRPGQFVSDVGTVAGHMAQAAKENPAEFIGGMLPGIGNIYSLRDIDELKAKIAAARAAGDEETALKLEKFAPLAAVGAAAPFGAGAAVGAVTKAAERAAVKGVARELSPIGLYSYGAEAASMLPQAKGTPEQIAAMLQKQGVKPTEMEGFAETFAGRPFVTKEEATEFFKGRVPQVEEKVLGRDSQLLENLRRQNEELKNQFNSFEDGNPNRAVLMDQMRDIFDKMNKIKNSSSATKYGDYTLPGGQNYREILLKSSNSSRPKIEEKYGRYGFTGPDGQYRDYWSLNDAEQAARSFYRDSGSFKSAHWDDPDVLAHIRMADRTGPNGEKILHVEEIQSDWAQKGRKEGFKDPNAAEAARQAQLDYSNLKQEIKDKFAEGLVDRNASMPVEEQKRIILQTLERGSSVDQIAEQMGLKQKLDEAYERTLEAVKKTEGVTPAPYVTSTQGWTDLALKRVLKEAAEGGYDKVVWTPGTEQAKRYDLSKQISRLVLEEGADGNQLLRAYSPSGDQVISRTIADPQKELPDLIGKEVSEKLLSQDPLTPKRFSETLTSSDISVVPKENRYQISAPWGWSTHVGKGTVGSEKEAAEYAANYFNKLAKEANNNLEYQGSKVRALEGQQLSVGGEGMKGYYDKIVPTQLAKLTKKLDPEAKIEKSRIPVQNYTISAPDIAKELGMSVDEVAALPHEQKMALINTVRHSIAAPSLTITPKMREAIMQGLPSYAEGGEVEASDESESKQAEIKKCLIDLRTAAKERKVYRPKLAYLIRQMGGADHSRSQILANNLINDDLDDLVQRLENQPRAVSMIKKLTEKID